MASGNYEPLFASGAHFSIQPPDALLSGDAEPTKSRQGSSHRKSGSSGSKKKGKGGTPKDGGAAAGTTWANGLAGASSASSTSVNGQGGGGGRKRSADGHHEEGSSHKKSKSSGKSSGGNSNKGGHQLDAVSPATSIGGNSMNDGDMWGGPGGDKNKANLNKKKRHPSQAPPAPPPTSSRVPAPTFFPYVQLPANLAPSQLRDPTFLRTLRNFPQNPAECFGRERENLLVDLKRAADLFKAQKDFIDKQIGLLDTWKSQVWVDTGKSSSKAPQEADLGLPSDVSGLQIMGEDLPFLLDDDDLGGLFDDGDDGMLFAIDMLDKDVTAVPPVVPEAPGPPPFPRPASRATTVAAAQAGMVQPPTQPHGFGQAQMQAQAQAQAQAMAQAQAHAHAQAQAQAHAHAQAQAQAHAHAQAQAKARAHAHAQAQAQAHAHAHAHAQSMMSPSMLPSDASSLTGQASLDGGYSTSTPMEVASLGGGEGVRYRTIRVRIRCESIPPLKKKATTLLARVPITSDNDAESVQSSVVTSVSSTAKASRASPLTKVKKESNSAAPKMDKSRMVEKLNKSRAQQLAKAQAASTGSPAQGGNRGPGAGGGQAQSDTGPYSDPLDAYAEFDLTTGNLWLYVGEAGYFNPILQALGGPTSIAAAERVLADMLPFTGDEVLERDSLSRDLGEDFEPLLDSVLDEYSAQRACRVDVGKQMSLQEERNSLVYLAEEGYQRDLARSPLFRRLLGALVQPPDVSIPNSASSSSNDDDEKSCPTPLAPAEEGGSTTAGRCRGHTPPGAESGWTPLGQRKAAANGNKALASALAKCERHLQGGMLIGGQPHDSTLPDPPPQPPPAADALNSRPHGDPKSPGRGAGELDERLMEELEALGILDPVFDREHVRRLSKGPTHTESSATVARERMETELGMWLRQDERLGLAINRANNLRVGKLRQRVADAVREELEAKTKQLASDDEIVERYHKLIRRKKAQAAQLAAAEANAKQQAQAVAAQVAKETLQLQQQYQLARVTRTAAAVLEGPPRQAKQPQPERHAEQLQQQLQQQQQQQQQQQPQAMDISAPMVQAPDAPPQEQTLPPPSLPPPPPPAFLQPPPPPPLPPQPMDSDVVPPNTGLAGGFAQPIIGQQHEPPEGSGGMLEWGLLGDMDTALWQS